MAKTAPIDREPEATPAPPRPGAAQDSATPEMIKARLPFAADGFVQACVADGLTMDTVLDLAVATLLSRAEKAEAKRDESIIALESARAAIEELKTEAALTLDAGNGVPIVMARALMVGERIREIGEPIAVVHFADGVQLHNLADLCRYHHAVQGEAIERGGDTPGT